MVCDVFEFGSLSLLSRYCHFRKYRSADHTNHKHKKLLGNLTYFSQIFNSWILRNFFTNDYQKFSNWVSIIWHKSFWGRWTLICVKIDWCIESDNSISRVIVSKLSFFAVLLFDKKILLYCYYYLYCCMQRLCSKGPPFEC